MKDLQKPLNIMQQALDEVMCGKNLDKWDKEASEAIEEIDSLIKQTGGPVAGYEKLKNELWFLKYLIAEKI